MYGTVVLYDDTWSREGTGASLEGVRKVRQHPLKFVSGWDAPLLKATINL